MTQSNAGGTNYQVQTSENNKNFYGGEHTHNYPPTPDAMLGVPQNLPIDTLESFVGSLNWVKKRARSLYGLSPSQEDQLVRAINQARGEPILDFYPIEIDVLELATHYVFYCLQDRPSRRFKKMSGKEYIRKLTDLFQKGQNIRVGKEKLSILVRESENRLKVKEDLSKIIEKFEVYNEV